MLKQPPAILLFVVAGFLPGILTGAWIMDTSESSANDAGDLTITHIRCHHVAENVTALWPEKDAEGKLHRNVKSLVLPDGACVLLMPDESIVSQETAERFVREEVAARRNGGGA